MADPNTQIDWWIAQTWQEAQGGADSDALVGWLHENGLTAISSYTIVQAALSCTPEEAKEMVFGNPVWAGEEPDPDIADRDYTSDTLEPEPEPDPTFELDDWAEQVEEDVPVYGEEGYQADPSAGAVLPDLSASADPEPAFEQTDGLEQADDSGQAGGFDAAPAHSFEPDTQPLTAPEIEPAPMDAMPLAAEAAPSPDLEAPPAAVEPETPPPPPILRTPPTTPAERAAAFAHAFGKKPAAATPAKPDSGPSAPAPEAAPDKAPPSNDMGPATEAETALAQSENDQPHPAMTTAHMPPPLVYEPLPAIEMPQPAAPVEPLFAAAPRDPQPAPPLFLAAESPQPAADTDLLERKQRANPDAMNGANGTPRDDAGEPALAADEPQVPSAPDEAEFRDDSEPPSNGADTAAAPGLATGVTSGDLPPGMEATMEDGETDPPGDMADLWEEEGDGLSPDGREQELPPLDGAENEEDEADYSTVSDGPEEGGAMDYEAVGDEADAPRPQKRTLLDPADEAGDTGDPGGDPGEIHLGDAPENLSEAARKLGISFREGDPTAAGVDPELAQAAKELGISFREGGSAAELDMDETALEAQKLGISFREGGSISSKTEKPLIVKYLPMIIGIVIIFFMLLLGATFAGPVISWLKS